MIIEIESIEKAFKGMIPGARVSADTVGDLINQMRGEENQDHQGDSEADTDDAFGQSGKKAVIPKTVVSAKSELDELRELLMSRQDLEIDSGGRITAAGSSGGRTGTETAGKASGAEKAKVIPKATVSAPQWYETNRDLYDMEVRAMREEFGNPDLQPKFMDDGRMYWIVNARPKLGKDSDGNEYKTLKYKLLLVYDQDHPKERFGSSVKVYPADPTVSEIQSLVNRLPNIPRDEKGLPHLLPDESGNLYLCSADASDVSSDISKGITSAVTSFRFAYRWLTILELGFRDPKTWKAFRSHGQI